MLWFRKNNISAQSIKARTDKLMRQALRDVKRRIRKGELIDGHSLGLYLSTIDAKYAHIKADINNATRVANYTKLRAKKIAETRELIEFYPTDFASLNSLHNILIDKAKDARRVDDFKHDRQLPPDMNKPKHDFEKLTNEDTKQDRQSMPVVNKPRHNFEKLTNEEIKHGSKS